MQILSVNVGARKTQTNGTHLETTGIYKLPAAGQVRVTALGLRDDFIGDPEHHGGPDQAIYIYGAPDYEWWSHELGGPLQPGTFGENLTISELVSSTLSIGDRLSIGPVVLEVTAGRHPCATLAARMRDPDFVKRFRNAERPGLYCRVLTEGDVSAGQAVERQTYPSEGVTILEMFREHYRSEKNEEEIRRILRAPISTRARARLQRNLEKLLTGREGRSSPDSS